MNQGSSEIFAPSTDGLQTGYFADSGGESTETGLAGVAIFAQMAKI